MPKSSGRPPRVTMVQAAKQAGWAVTAPRRAFLGDLAAACSGWGRPPVVAVLAPAAGSPVDPMEWLRAQGLDP